ncbi:MAG: hypothetical protein ACXVLQ_14910 [Bacteriovorax sp.]
MKALLITFSLFISVAQAGDRTSAYNAICKPMSFDSDRDKCLATIKNYTYFDNRGLGICAALSFDSNKMSCLDLIGDKTYEGYEMDACINESFDSKKLECLKQNGTPYNPNRPSCVSRNEAIDQLSSSLRDLRSGNLRDADNKISYLLGRFTDCI